MARTLLRDTRSFKLWWTNSICDRWRKLGRKEGKGTCLHDDEFALALVADLEEGLAGHVLDARVRLVHELEQLVHDRLQELPVVAQEPRILSHHIPALMPESSHSCQAHMGKSPSKIYGSQQTPALLPHTLRPKRPTCAASQPAEC